MTAPLSIPANGLKIHLPPAPKDDPARLANRLSSPDAAPSGRAEARRVAQQFESLFLNQMLEHMSASLKTDGPFGGGQGEQIFRSLLNQEYAGSLQKRGGIGLADDIYNQILKLQQV